MPTIATTTINSIRVKPRSPLFLKIRSQSFTIALNLISSDHHRLQRIRSQLLRKAADHRLGVPLGAERPDSHPVKRPAVGLHSFNVYRFVILFHLLLDLKGILLRLIGADLDKEQALISISPPLRRKADDLNLNLRR